MVIPKQTTTVTGQVTFSISRLITTPSQKTSKTVGLISVI